jgi:hypothetical protein
MGARTFVSGMLRQVVGQDSTNHSCACRKITWCGLILQGGEWARSMPKDSLWPLIIAPPAIGDMSDVVSGRPDAWMHHRSIVRIKHPPG